MNNTELSKYKKPITIVVVIISVLLFIFIIYRNFYFQILSVAPADSKVNIGSSFIIINTNKALKELSNDSIIESPSNIVQKVETKKNQIIITTKNIEKDKKYKIVIKDITSSSGDKINFYQYYFTGKYITYNGLNNEVKQESLKTTDKGNINDRAIEILPKTTDKFYLKYELFPEPTQKGRYVKIIAALLITKYQETDLKLISDYKKSAIKYLVDNGVDPNSYVIEWYPRQAQKL